MMEAKSWAESRAEIISDSLKEKTPYEIQEYCFDFVQEMQVRESNESEDEVFVRRMKDCSFEVGASFHAVGRVAALELRNAILNELGIPLDHPELDQ